MALLSHGVVVSLPSTKVPAGYTPVSVTTFDDQDYVIEKRELSITKTGIINNTQTTALTDLLAAIKTNLDAEITADFDVSRNVEVYMKFVDVDFNQYGADFLCDVDIFVKTS